MFSMSPSPLSSLLSDDSSDSNNEANLLHPACPSSWDDDAAADAKANREPREQAMIRSGLRNLFLHYSSDRHGMHGTLYSKPTEPLLRRLADIIVNDFVIVTHRPGISIADAAAAASVPKRTRATSLLRVYQVLELEFYIYAPGVHPDPFSHRDPLQQHAALWYLHPSGGTRKGLDVTIGRGETQSAGILLRSLQPLAHTGEQLGSVIRGPSLCVDAIFDDIGVSRVAEFRDRISLEADYCMSTPDLDSSRAGPWVRFVPVALLVEILPITTQGERLGSLSTVCPSPYFPAPESVGKDDDPPTKRHRSNRCNDLHEPECVRANGQMWGLRPRLPLLATPRIGLVPKPVPPAPPDSLIVQKSLTPVGRASQQTPHARRTRKDEWPPVNEQLAYAFAPYRYLAQPESCTKRSMTFLGIVGRGLLQHAPDGAMQPLSWDELELHLKTESQEAIARTGMRPIHQANYTQWMMEGVAECVAAGKAGKSNSATLLHARVAHLQKQPGSAERWMRLFGSYLACRLAR